MSETDSSEALPKGKTNVLSRPVLIPGCPCTKAEIIEFFGMADATFSRWIEHGLKAFCPMIQADVYFTDDVFDFIRKFPVTPEMREQRRRDRQPKPKKTKGRK